MIKSICFMVLVCLALTIKAQDLVQLRYYFNSSAENLHEISLESLEELNDQFTIDLTGLPQGIHTLYIDLLDSNGSWSHYDQVMLQVVGGLNMYTLNSFEYFFDDDPGFGNGIQIAINGAEFDGELDVSMNGLSQGLHWVYFRFKDGENQWTHYCSQCIQVTGGGYENLTTLEYFFDSDPGYGNGNTINLEANHALDTEMGIAIPENLELGSHIIYFRIQDSSGQWSHYDQDTLDVCEITFPTITTSGSFCDGETVILDANDDYTTYLWSNGSEDDSTVVTTSGNYLLTVSDDDCSTSISSEIIFTTLPIPEITSSGNTLNTTSGDYNYEWTLNGNVIPDNNQPNFTPETNGVVEVTISQGNCSSTSELFQFVIDGLLNNLQQQLIIYPNPSNGLFEFKTLSQGILEVIDMSGRMVFSTNVQQNSNKIDLTNYPAGTYFGQWKCSSGVFAFPILLVK